MKRTFAALALVASLAALTVGRASAAPTCSGWTPPSTDQYVGSVAVDSASMLGSTFALPASGTYRVVSCGVWNNWSHGYVDTAYNSGDAWNWSAPQQGWPGIGTTWGELTLNGAFPSWGAYNAGHLYSTTLTGVSGALALLIYDGYPGSGLVSGWYGDNGGSLTVDIYRVNPRPTSTAQCLKDGWKSYGVFKNQGDCVSYVATGGTNRPG